MNAFEHVSVLLSFVYALALAHLLSRIGTLLTLRRRVRFSGLAALAMFDVMLMVFANWLSLWDLRTVRTWDILTITSQFVMAVLQFAACSVAVPEAVGEGAIDLDAFYFEQRPMYWGLLTALLASALLANIAFLKSANVALFVGENLATLFMFPPAVLALVMKARWAQWAGGIGLLLMLLYFTVTFEGVLG